MGATIFLAEQSFSQEKLQRTDSTNVTVIVIFLSIQLPSSPGGVARDI
jgi:hypothetical protein